MTPSGRRDNVKLMVWLMTITLVSWWVYFLIVNWRQVRYFMGTLWLKATGQIK